MENQTEKINIRVEKPAVSWQIKSPNLMPKTAEWLWAIGIFGFAIAIFSILLKNYLLLIIVIISAFIIYAMKKRESELYTFRIDENGLHIEHKLYHYNRFESFWVFESSVNGEHEFALHHKHHLTPLLIIPFHEKDKDAIRKILSEHLEESEEKEPLLDLLRKRLF
jgi:hypothetical protein